MLQQASWLSTWSQLNILLYPAQTQCYKITAGRYVLLPQGTVAMILGRSGLTSQGFTVHPGIINEDFKGEINVKASVK
jgi:dUTPase